MSYEQSGAVLVVGDAQRHPVGDVVAADNHTAGVHTGVAHIAFERFGIMEGGAHQRVAAVVFRLQFGDILHAVFYSDFGGFAVGLRWKGIGTVGNHFREAVALAEG